MEETKPNWSMGYKEVKNFMHNDLGITREYMQDIIKQILREEVAETVGRNGDFIRHAIKEIIRQEMLYALDEQRFPRVQANVWNYSEDSKVKFSEFMAAIVKEEVLWMFREQFDVGINIKENVATKE